MKLFVYAAFVASFLLGFIWNGSSVHAQSGDPKPETKKSECPYLNGQTSGVCPYSGKKDKTTGECPYTGKKSSPSTGKKEKKSAECPYIGKSGSCPYSGEAGKTTSERPVKKIEVKKV